MKKILMLVVLLGAAAAGWFFLSPLFIDETVDEPLSFVLAEGGLDMTAVDAMSDADRLANRDAIMEAAAGAPDKNAAEPMPAEPIVLVQGQFRDADAIHKGSGSATVYRLPDGKRVLRLEDFRTTNGPALVVYAAQHRDPQNADDVTSSGFVNLGKLKGNVGNQNYEIPADVADGDLGSIVIWCELFGVLFSPAPLTSA
ncbi:MAG: DM13 domain-containing protein [Pseudomonadota bacterium]